MKAIIKEYIESELLSGSSKNGVSNDDDLLGGGIIDSLGIMNLISFIEREASISVPPEDMVIENFLSVDAIGDYIERKRTGAAN